MPITAGHSSDFSASRELSQDKTVRLLQGAPDGVTPCLSVPNSGVAWAITPDRRSAAQCAPLPKREVACSSPLHVERPAAGDDVRRNSDDLVCMPSVAARGR